MLSFVPHRLQLLSVNPYSSTHNYSSRIAVRAVLVVRRLRIVDATLALLPFAAFTPERDYITDMTFDVATELI